MWFCTGHALGEELDGSAVWVAETTQHEPSVFLPPHHHVPLLAHRTGANCLTQYELIYRDVGAHAGGGREGGREEGEREGGRKEEVQVRQRKRKGGRVKARK